MTGHNMLIVTGHFVLEVHGMSHHIPSDFLGNDHRGSFYLQGRLICFFIHKDQMGQIDPKERLRVKKFFYENLINMDSFFSQIS